MGFHTKNPTTSTCYKTDENENLCVHHCPSRDLELFQLPSSSSPPFIFHCASTTLLPFQWRQPAHQSLSKPSTHSFYLPPLELARASQSPHSHLGSSAIRAPSPPAGAAPRTATSTAAETTTAGKPSNTSRAHLPPPIPRHRGRRRLLLRRRRAHPPRRPPPTASFSTSGPAATPGTAARSAPPS